MKACSLWAHIWAPFSHFFSTGLHVRVVRGLSLIPLNTSDLL